MSEKKIAIGIDLGTSKCCVGVMRNGKVEILENERGNKTTPSYVAFTDTERLVGENAKDQARFNPTNTLNGMKRIMGRDPEDPLVTEYCKNVPFAVIAKENDLCVRASYKGHKELLYPQQITASLLQKMKSTVEAAFRCTVEQAVISVPASFENSQRQATKEAATIAGLEVLALINEPTAAAIAYLQNKTKEESEVIAIIDFGGGKLDVAIVAVSKSEVEVLAVRGSHEVGGEYLDELLVQRAMKAILAKFGEGFIPNKNLLSRLRVGCEKAKKTLTLLPKSSILIDCVKEEEDFHIDISREHFHGMITSKLHPVLKRCLDGAFQASGLNKSEVSRALLVGGSSRIPLFKEWLKEYLDPIPIVQTVNPDEAIASGAALYAAFLSGVYDIPPIIIKDILSNNFGMSREGNPNVENVFSTSKVTIPSTHVTPYSTRSSFNDQTNGETFEIFEEVSDRNHHKLIGTLCLSDEFARATCLIQDVTFTIDRCGIFDIAASLSTPPTIFSSIVKDYAGKLQNEKLSKAVRREEMFQSDERAELKRVETCTVFEKLCYEIISKVKCSLYKDEFPELVESLSACAAKGLDWVEDNMLVSTVEVLYRLEPLEALYEEFTTKVENLEKETLERTAEVAELASLCTNIDVLLRTHEVWSEHSTTSSEMRSEVEQITQWLTLTETPSRIDCQEKKNALENVFAKSVSRLIDNQQIINLRNYCLDLRETLPNNVDYEHFPQKRESLICEVDDCLGWLDNTKRAFTAECVKRMSSLKNLHRELVELGGSNSAAQEQKVHDPALLLRRICLQTRDLVKKCSKICEMDPQKVKDTKKLIMNFLCLIDRREKVSTDEWERKISEILVSKVMFESNLRKHEQMRLNEEERLATLRDLLKSRSSMQGKMVNFFKPKDCSRAMEVADELVSWLETPNMFSKEEYEKRAERWETINGRVNERIDKKVKEDLAANLGNL